MILIDIRYKIIIFVNQYHHVVLLICRPLFILDYIVRDLECKDDEESYAVFF